MAARHIIPAEPASPGGVTVVVEVQQHGPQPLDVRLVGCEGESPYVATIEHCNLGKWRHKFKGTEEEWVTMLSFFLLQHPLEKAQVSLLHGVRMVHTLKTDNLELSFRRDVGDIKVTLGVIVLPMDDEFEFNPFEWAQTSATAHARTQQQLADVMARIKCEQDTVAKLNAQLQDFIKTKHETETAMLQQFMGLLNEKKRKIRDQSRILAGANVDHDTASVVQTTRTTGTSRKTSASRSSKRKASAQTTDGDAKAESDGEVMDVDVTKEEEQDEDALASIATPDRTDDETDAEEQVSVLPSQTKSSETVQARSRKTKKEEERLDGVDEVESVGVPPPRSLPFGRATRSRVVAKKAPAVTEDGDGGDDDDDDDDETDDEEL